MEHFGASYHGALRAVNCCLFPRARVWADREVRYFLVLEWIDP